MAEILQNPNKAAMLLVMVALGVAGVIFLAIMWIKDAKAVKNEHEYTADGNYLYIKAYSPYISGIAGADIRLTFMQKIKILFCKGVCVCIGDAIKKDGAKDGK